VLRVISSEAAPEFINTGESSTAKELNSVLRDCQYIYARTFIHYGAQSNHRCAAPARVE
jgi:hypothetical protein